MRLRRGVVVLGQRPYGLVALAVLRLSRLLRRGDARGLQEVLGGAVRLGGTQRERRARTGLRRRGALLRGRERPAPAPGGPGLLGGRDGGQRERRGERVALGRLGAVGCVG
ncbi:hypothetical protein GCM10019017_40650 [Streptomyces showdoensis]